MAGRLSSEKWWGCRRDAWHCALGVLAFTGTVRAQTADHAPHPQAPSIPRIAEADPSEQSVAPKGTLKQPPAKSVRYAYQTLLADLAAVVVGFATKSFTAGGAVFIAGAPVIHFAHRNLGSGLASLGTRAVAIGVIHRLSSCKDDPTPEQDPSDDGTGACVDDRALGALAMLSLPLVAGFDAAVLAKKPVRQTSASTWSLSPMVSQRRSGVWLTGRF